jgi:hypothetical protein
MTTEIGDRVKFIKSSRTDIQLSGGDEGTVWRVTPIGTVRVKWDKGARFDLQPGKDEWELVSNGHKEIAVNLN